MSKMTCQAVFRKAMRDRRANHPLDRISAYKVSEVRGTIERLLRTVVEVAAFVTGGSSAPVPFLLGCCTTEDKATWLKDLPGHIARELGYNLIPAIEALTVEGVPAGDIATFIGSIKAQVDQLLVDCDAVQMGNARSIKPEYVAMTAGNSDLIRLSKEALRIADLAVEFCEQHRVL